jgi:hypothetical protein
MWLDVQSGTTVGSEFNLEMLFIEELVNTLHYLLN